MSRTPRPTPASMSARPAVRPSAGLPTVLGLLLALVLGAGSVVAPPAAGAQVKLPRLPKVPSGEPIRGLSPNPSEGGRQQRPADEVPPAYYPPAGMCRVWLQGVPPASQPASTDCPTAIRNRPANGRVLFGDDYVKERGRRTSVDVVPEGLTSHALAAPALPDGPWPTARAATPRAHGPAPDDDEAPGALAWPASYGPSLEGTAGAMGTTGRGTVADTTPRPVARVRPAEARDPRVARDARDDRQDRLARAEARRALRDADALDEPDEWEDGYRAGYEDALRGRAPRAAGVRFPRGGARPGVVTEGAVDPAADGEVGAVRGRGTTAVIVPPGDDPRYFNNGRFPPPGRANGTCLDRDADGWCDDPRYGAPVCRDLDGDGRCDDYPGLASAAYPSALPDMRAGSDVQRGRGSDVALRWLGTAEVIARPTDLRRTGVPSRIVWLDANTNALLQVWTDRDGDGTADRVEIFRNGRRVKLLGR